MVMLTTMIISADDNDVDLGITFCPNSANNAISVVYTIFLYNEFIFIYKHWVVNPV